MYEVYRFFRRNRSRPVPKDKLYIAGEHLDYVWNERELTIVRRLWEEGWHIGVMGERLKRNPMEVFIVVEDLAGKKLLDEREGGYRGWRA